MHADLLAERRARESLEQRVRQLEMKPQLASQLLDDDVDRALAVVGGFGEEKAWGKKWWSRTHSKISEAYTASSTPLVFAEPCVRQTRTRFFSHAPFSAGRPKPRSLYKPMRLLMLRAARLGSRREQQSSVNPQARAQRGISDRGVDAQHSTAAPAVGGCSFGVLCQL